MGKRRAETYWINENCAIRLLSSIMFIAAPDDVTERTTNPSFIECVTRKNKKIKWNRIIECRHLCRSHRFWSKTRNKQPKMQGFCLASLKTHPSVKKFHDINDKYGWKMVFVGVKIERISRCVISTQFKIRNLHNRQWPMTMVIFGYAGTFGGTISGKFWIYSVDGKTDFVSWMKWAKGKRKHIECIKGVRRSPIRQSMICPDIFNSI